MTDTQPSDAAARAEEARIREEWRRLERQRIVDEIAEAREDAATAARERRGPHWAVWVALAVAFLAGVAVTILVNGLLDRPR